MTDTAPSGMRRPDDNATLASTAATLRQHANSILQGTTTFTGTIAAGAAQVINFSINAGYFSGAPAVIAQVADGSGPATFIIARTAYANTATSGIIILRNLGTATATLTNMKLQWVAFGPGSEIGG